MESMVLGQALTVALAMRAMVEAPKGSPPTKNPSMLAA
jgi:hypothetical protein